MSCAELRSTSHKKHERNCECSSGITLHPRSKSESLTDCRSLSVFQTLAENCGFKVIRDDSEYNSDCCYGSECSEVTSVETTASCPSRWSTESCCGHQETHCSKKDDRDSTAVYKQPDKVLTSETTTQQSIAPQTYLVSRNCGKATEPTVDYLDMTDAGNAMETCRTYKVTSQKGNFADGYSSFGLAPVQYTIQRDRHRHVVNNHKRKTRYKNIKLDLSNAKGRHRSERDKVLNAGQISTKSVKLQCGQSYTFGKDQEYHPEMANMQPCKNNTKILICKNSSASELEDSYLEKIAGLSEDGREEQKHLQKDCRINERLTESMQHDGSDKCLSKNKEKTSEGGQVGIQAFSNINSSCLHQRSSLQNNIYCPNKDAEAGMLSYMRTQRGDSNLNRKSRSHFRDTRRNPSLTINSRSASLSSISRSINQEVSDKRCHPVNKEKEILNMPTKLTFGHKSLQSPISGRFLRLRQMPSSAKETPNMARFHFGNYIPRRVRSASNSSQSEMTNGAQESTITQNGADSEAVPSDENLPQDYNINFNSDVPCCDESSGANCFIGNYLYELWKNQCLCDVKLQVGNTSFKAHKIVLAAFSDLFCPENPHEVTAMRFEIPDVAEDAVGLILQYLYTSEMEITDNLLESVYIAATILEITEIQDLVKEILSKPTIDNFEKYMSIRESVGLPTEILKDYKDFIRQNLLDVDDSPYILHMELEELIQLLRDPEVMIESEEDIVRLIIRWIKFSPCQRSKNAATLLNLVNFDCIGPESLSQILDENRYLFDIASMDIFMRAFKNLALKSKDNFIPPECCSHYKLGYNKPSQVQSFREDDQDDEVSDYAHKEDSDFRKREKKSRISRVSISPRDIRKNVTKQGFTSLDKDNNFTNKRRPTFSEDNDSRLNKYIEKSVTNHNAETKYTCRGSKKAHFDSCDNYPSELHDTSSSAKSELRFGNGGRYPISRSDSETDQCTPSYVYSCTQDGPILRKRTLPTRTAYINFCSSEQVDKSTQDYGPNFIRERDPRSTCWLNNCQSCQKSQPSSRSSGSSHKIKYNGSSSGSIKRVSFS